MKHALKLYIAMGTFVFTMAGLVLLADHTLTFGQYCMTFIAVSGGCAIAAFEWADWKNEEETRATSQWGEQLEDRCE